MSTLEEILEYCEANVEFEDRERFLIKQLWSKPGVDMTDFGVCAEYLGLELRWALFNYEIFISSMEERRKGPAAPR